MKAVFPGKPQAKLHALSTALWEGQRFLAYISNNALIILNSPTFILQTISQAESDFLEAVAFCESSGKIATCTATTIFVYRPFGLEAGVPTWSLQHTLTPACNDTSLTCLSWGLPEELLASGSHTTLFHTQSEPREMWSRVLANPAKFAVFTPDASFIASTGWQDKLVKIWERLFLDEEEERFDVSYLSHPASVTTLRWHRRPHQDHHSDTVLYTTSADSKLRIWAATDHHALQPLQLWTEFDLADCILLRNPDPLTANSKQYLFILDGWEFESLVEQSIHHSIGGEREKSTREHLLDVAYRNPDICVVLDNQGHMSAWGLERVGCEARQQSDVFNILLAEQVNFRFPSSLISDQDYMCLYNFAGTNDATLNVLANHFDGTIHWLSSPVDHFFDTASSAKRFEIDATLTGAAEPIDALICSTSHNTLLSIGSYHELVVWSQDIQNSRAPLSRSGVCKTPHSISLASLIADDRYLVVVQEHAISVWNIQHPVPFEIVTSSFQLQKSPSCLVRLPQRAGSEDEFFVLLTTDMEGLVFRLIKSKDSDSVGLETFTTLENKDYKVCDISAVHTIKNHSDKITGASVASITSTGLLTLWRFQLDIENNSCFLKRQTSLDTLVDGSSIAMVDAHGKAAIVSTQKNRLTIWDTTLGHLEYVETFKAHETIESLDFTCTNDCHTLLAIASLHKAHVYSQDRYCFTNGSPAWILLRTFEIGQQTNVPISDCVWLSSYDLLLAAGNQMFLFDGSADVPDSIISSVELPSNAATNKSMTKITNALNAVPAIFHPELNAQMLASGNLDTIDLLLNKLRTTLKFWSHGDKLDSSLGISLSNGFDIDQASRPSENGSPNGELDESLSEPFSAESAAALNDILDAIDMPFISDEQQIQLSNLADSFGFFEKHRGGVDSLGMRYLVNLHQHVEAPAAARLQLPWRDVVWAFHSETQEILIDLTSRMYGGRMIWKDARECGMFLWIQDLEAVRAQFEVIARSEYTKTDERNPLDCSLYYLALKKKSVLQGLWRLASWNKEQRPTMRLLSNNFNEPRWRTAAMKNAYALMGLRRFEYAAAFFLLADRLKDAVTVLASQVNDIQLAIAVARVYEGDNGPVLKELLQERVLPKAAREGDRWLATWVFWMLRDTNMALCALTEPLEKLVKMAAPAPIESKHYQKAEPALAAFFHHLREKIQKTPHETLSVNPEAEWDLVKRSALAYVRAGCHLLALDLVRNWRFSDYTRPKKLNGAEAATKAAVIETKTQTDQLNGHTEGSSILDGWNSDTADTSKMNGSLLPERTKVHEEPSTASILDNFDF